MGFFFIRRPRQLDSLPEKRRRRAMIRDGVFYTVSIGYNTDVFYVTSEEFKQLRKELRIDLDGYFIDNQ